jgi:hypothetical protein
MKCDAKDILIFKAGMSRAAVLFVFVPGIKDRGNFPGSVI